MKTYFTELCSRLCTAAFSSFCTHSWGHRDRSSKSSFTTPFLCLSCSLLQGNRQMTLINPPLFRFRFPVRLLLRLFHVCSQFPGSYADLVAHPIFLPLTAPPSTPLLIHSHTLASVPTAWRHVLPGISGGHTWTDVKQETYSPHTLLNTREDNRDQGTEHPPSKHKARCQHLDLSSQTQIPSSQFKNTVSNNQDNMFSLESSNPTI